MPDPIGWMTAYRTKDGKGGLFIRFKGDDGGLVHTEFEDAKTQLETALGFPFELGFMETFFEHQNSVPMK